MTKYTGNFIFADSTYPAACAIIQPVYSGIRNSVAGTVKIYASAADAAPYVPVLAPGQTWASPANSNKTVGDPIATITVSGTIGSGKTPLQVIESAFVGMAQFASWSKVAGS